VSFKTVPYTPTHRNLSLDFALRVPKDNRCYGFCRHGRSSGFQVIGVTDTKKDRREEFDAEIRRNLFTKTVGRDKCDGPRELSNAVLNCHLPQTAMVSTPNRRRRQRIDRVTKSLFFFFFETILIVFFIFFFLV